MKFIASDKEKFLLIEEISKKLPKVVLDNLESMEYGFFIKCIIKPSFNSILNIYIPPGILHSITQEKNKITFSVAEVMYIYEGPLDYQKIQYHFLT